MISANFAEVRKALEAYKKEVDRKLTYMVRAFAYSVTETAIGNTPLGDAEKYMDFYLARQKRIGLLPIEGFARGSWQVSNTSGLDLQFLYTDSSGDNALALAKTNLSGYKLGDDFYIGNKGYYIRYLNGDSTNQEFGRIMRPTINTITSVLQTDLVRLFNEG